MYQDFLWIENEEIDLSGKACEYFYLKDGDYLDKKVLEICPKKKI